LSARTLRSAAVGVAALVCTACAEVSPRAEAPPEPDTFVDMMIERYGPPDHAEGGRFVWERRGLWRRISVRDDLEPSGVAQPLEDIQETIAYRVPQARRAALAAFGGAVEESADGEELSARSSGEERNFLLLNLADAIVGGGLSPEAARVDYLRALTLDASGKSSPAMRRLLFR
jgi:hypothetical protein